jgi:hypothetical protein
MNFSKRIFPLIIGVSILTLLTFSCNKEELPSLNNTESSYYPSAGSFRSLTMPIVENGMLSFSDQEHFDEYLDYLDAIVMNEPQSEEEEDSDETEIDDKLLAVEQSLGFQSLRAKLYVDFVTLDEVGFSSLDEIPEEYYISSSAYRSIFNEDQEVKIGSSIWVYYNEDYFIEITDASLDTRDAIRLAKSGSPNEVPTSIRVKENIKIIPTTAEAQKERPGVGTYSESDGQNGDPTTKCNGVRVLSPLYDLRDPCDPFTQVIRIESGILCGAVLDYWDQSITLRIDWGDGSVEFFTLADGNGNIPISHRYNNQGDYTIEIIGELDADQTPLSANPAEIGVVNIGVNCLANETSSGRVWKYSIETGSDRRAYSSELIKQNRIGNSVWGRSRVCGITRSYHWKNNRWRSKRVERLVVQFTANTRGDDCTIYRTESGAVWPYNSRKAERAKTIDFQHLLEGDIESNHRMKHNDKYYTHDHSLTPPPPDC